MLPPKMMIASGALLAASLMAASVAQAQTVWYVNDDGNADNGCTSWPDACPELQTALSLAGDGDQIWVAEGTYRPDYDTKTGQHTGDREASFQLINGVEMYGGFVGTESSLEERAELFDQTILSGDLNGDDGADFANNGENSYHVATGSGTGESAILDGFTVTAGNANEDSNGHDAGGGMYNSVGSPTLANCLFRENSGGIRIESTSTCCAEHESPGCDDPGCESAVCDYYPSCCIDAWTADCVDFAEYGCNVCHPTFSGGGGGIYNTNSDPELVNCTFSGNYSAANGGGMFNKSSSPTVTDCSFVGNIAAIEDTFGGGGGMYNENSGPAVTDCTFNGNTTNFVGGGMYNLNSSPTVTGCNFSGNSSSIHGGGMYNRNASSPIITYCTFSGNTAGYEGGGMASDPNNTNGPTVIHCKFIGNTATLSNGGGMSNSSGLLTLTHCTFSGNTAGGSGGGMRIFNLNPTVTHCTFSGNSANYGGGMANRYYSYPVVINCTFSENNASYGGAMANQQHSEPTVINSVLWDNSPDQIYPGSSGGLPVRYSDIQGGWPGEGNIDVNPAFVDADGPDGLPGTEDDDLRLQPGSPCIDAADNTAVPEGISTDLDGNPRFVDDLLAPETGVGGCLVVDMGAYEFQEGCTECCECGPDCNENGQTDVCDIAEGISEDCTGNGVPDECEPDCNENGAADSCDIADGTSEDCTGNGVPDECEPDCNENGVADSCDIADGTSEDCNANFIPDECDTAEGASQDCTENGIPDECEPDCNANGAADSCDIADGTSEDCTGNGVPDECEPDCNGNGVADSCDIAEGTSEDCTENGVPDECEPDCNGNGIADSCDIAEGTSGDCNTNFIPDECDLADGTSEDCNGNGIPDECDIAGGGSEDCNDNDTPDECEEVLGPIITTQPMSQDVQVGDFVFFTVVAEGILLEYQWRKDGVDLADTERIIGSQTSALLILDVEPGDEDNYDCVVTDFLTGCSTTSDVGVLTVTDPCTADFDGDGAVGAADLAMLLGSWGPCEGCPADLDGNGAVGAFDLALLLGNWGVCD